MCIRDRGDVVENFGGQFARDTHALCALGVFDGYGHVLDYPIQGVALADCSFSLHGSHVPQLKSLSSCDLHNLDFSYVQ